MKLLAVTLMMLISELASAQSWSEAQTKNKVQQAVKLMRKCEAPIIMGEAKSEPRCIQPIRQLLDDFDKQSHINKRIDDRYSNCWGALTEYKIWINDVRKPGALASGVVSGYKAYRDYLDDCEKSELGP